MVIIKLKSMTPFEKKVLQTISLYHPKEHIRTIAETAIIEENRALFTDEKIWETYAGLINETPRI